MEFDGLGLGGLFSLFGIPAHGFFLVVGLAAESVFLTPLWNAVLLVLSVVGVVAFGWGGDVADPDAEADL